MTHLLKQDIDKALCGLDVYETRGWTTDAYDILNDCIHRGGLELEAKIKECENRNLKLAPTENIFEDVEVVNADTDKIVTVRAYRPDVVFMVEFEIALNWLMWALSDWRKQLPDVAKPRLDHDYDLLEKAWSKQHNYCQRLYKNEDFSRLHFRMTD